MSSTPPVNLDERPRQREGLLSRAVDDGAIVYDPESGRVHSLNPAAGYIWECLDGSQTLAQIAESLCSLPGTEGHDLVRDVIGVVEEFRKVGLLEAQRSA